MKKILILIVSIGLVFGLIGVGTQSSFSDVETSRGNTFTAGVWRGNPGTYTITASAGDGGSISPSGEILVNKGEGKTYIITPDAGYVIDGVVVDEVDSVKDVLVEEDGSGTYEFTNVTDDHTIHATFVEEPVNTDQTEESVTYTITAKAAAGGSIEPSGEVIVPEGEDKTFTIKPDDGYKIADVSVDAESVGVVSSYQFTNVTQNHTIHATFEKIEYTITAKADAGGSIEPSGEVIVPEGEDKTFNITPDDGYKIAYVVVDGTSVGAVASHTFADVQADHSIHATFVEEPDDTDQTKESVTYTITASADASGSIEPSGEILVNKGDNQTFTIKPDDGYVIADVSVDGTSLGAVASHTFENVTGDHTIHATFK